MSDFASTPAPQPTHDEVVERLDQLLREIHAGRQECHAEVRHWWSSTSADAVEYALACIDRYGLNLATAIDDMTALRLQHPAAWEASAPCRQSREAERREKQMILEAMNLALFGWADGSNEDGDAAGDAPASP